jgi:hypothetical protein
VANESVVLFTGHRVDLPYRESPRFPRALTGAVARSLGAFLDDQHVISTFSSAAAGADLLLLTEALARGIATHIVLPYSPDEFEMSSVRPCGSEWVRRYRNVLGQTASLDTLEKDTERVFHATNQRLLQLARSASCNLQVRLIGLAVWDGRPADGLGGTADAVREWRQGGVETIVICPADGSLS